jgi:phosphoglycolate phosphatase-like HAD superfamily hydrolase
VVRQRVDNGRPRAPEVSRRSAQNVLRGVEILLLDFDGPICSIFAGYPAATVAQELREYVVGQGAQLADAAMWTDDPLEVLRATEHTGDLVLTRQAAALLRQCETIAATSATLTPGIREVLSAAKASGRIVAVVTNNADDAADAFLRLHGLASAVEATLGRQDWMFPHQMKPDPLLVQMALMGAHGTPAVLVGDSITDVQAAHAAGARCIGYANKPGKVAQLQDVGADAVIMSMYELAAALTETPVLPN